jgi:hypothetical protein
VKDFGLTNVEAGFVTAIPYVIGAIGMVHWGRRVVMQGGTLAEYFAAGEPCKRGPSLGLRAEIPCTERRGVRRQLCRSGRRPHSVSYDCGQFHVRRALEILAIYLCVRQKGRRLDDCAPPFVQSSKLDSRDGPVGFRSVDAC